MDSARIGISEKLAALRRLSLLIGILGSKRRISADAMMDREEAGYMVSSAMLGLTQPDRAWWQRVACGLILDVYMPEWRSRAKPEVLGPILTRNSPEVHIWRDAVLSRDGHACTKCGDTERLHAHHVLRWAQVPEARIVVDNGITLCEPCYVDEHRESRDGFFH